MESDRETKRSESCWCDKVDVTVRDERRRSFMSADMLRVERRHAQTVLTALSSTSSHLRVLLSL